MKVEGHRKQVALFLVAVLLPVIVLVALTLRMVTQERELALKRVADEHRRMAAEIGRDLTSRLDGLARGEASALAGEPLRLARRDYRNPEVVLVAKIDEARLVLPWEVDPKAAAPGPREDDSAFSRILRQAESAEFSSKNYPLAAARYGRAAAAARLPAGEGYARLQRARTLSRMKREEESLSEYEKVLFLSPEVVDEYGIPLSLYAVEQLLRRESIHPQAVEQIGRQLVGVTWRSPAGLYLLRDLVQQIIAGAPIPAGTALRSGAEENLRKILAQIQVMEQALSLKEDFPRLDLEPMPGRDLKTAESLWVSYGQKPWLVGLSPQVPGEESLLVAVDFQTFNSILASDAEYSAKYAADAELLAGSSADGISLGPGLQGIRVAFAPDGDNPYSKQGALQRYFYFLALVVVLSVTLFGAYLLWRDVRREVLMARMRSQFVSSVSHELKTPLTAIRMFAETLRLGRSKDPATQAEYLDTIVNESERLTRLLNNVLDFSKIEQGQRTYHPALASLAEILRAAARAMEYPLKQQGFDLDVRIDEGLPQVRVDRDAVEQAVLNLLSNAMKYSGESRTIGLGVRREGDSAVVQVIDKGVGIDPKDQAQIFEEYYRVPARENQSLPGTGLGLSLVAHIAKAHGGSVRVDSAPGQGSTFSIILPLENKP
ncbi:MAG: HAMP domain-containing sensor histidine kinase [Candidatus Aminicenantales bacterium]